MKFWLLNIFVILKIVIEFYLTAPEKCNNYFNLFRNASGNFNAINISKYFFYSVFTVK